MFLDNVIGNERPVSWVLNWPVLAASFVRAAATACARNALKFGIVDKPDNLVKTHKSLSRTWAAGMLRALRWAC